jgi:hypothetical protein
LRRTAEQRGPFRSDVSNDRSWWRRR